MVRRLIVNKQKLFGTDGIRGTPGVYPLTDYMLSIIAQALAQSLLEKKESRRKIRVVIGKDTRLSGANIENILSKNIAVLGIDVLLVGTITTPGLAYFVKELSCQAGIMISASHNKATDNGIKFFNAAGYKFTEEDEEKVENIIFERLVNKTRKISSAKKGKIIKFPNAQNRYAEFLQSTVKGLDLSGYTVALDCAWGAAAPFARNVFEGLGARVFSINDEPSGYNINQGGAINPEVLKQLVLDTSANIGIAVDGDGDRGIMVDEKGEIVDGDTTIAVIARYLSEQNRLKPNAVVGTVMSNYGLRVFLEQLGVRLITTNVGDKYVLDALLRNSLKLGGEQSGHIIFLDYLTTPDGLLTALQVLKVMKEYAQPLSKLSECMIKYPQVLINVKVKEKKPFEQIPRLSAILQECNAKLDGQGRILLRYSGTEQLARVMVEGKDKAVVENIANTLAEHIRQQIGAG